VLWLAQGKRAVQDEYFEFFTVVETPKMVEIRNFKYFDTISKKKNKMLNISEMIKVTKILQ